MVHSTPKKKFNKSSDLQFLLALPKNQWLQLFIKKFGSFLAISDLKTHVVLFDSFLFDYNFPSDITRNIKFWL